MEKQHFNREIKAALLLNQLGIALRNEAGVWLSQGKSLAEIIQTWFDESQPELQALLDRFNPEKEIHACASKEIDLIVISDAEYPELLRTISDPPFVLYARGKKELLHDLSVAVVGSRHASFYGAEQARRFSRVLCDAGLTIVSGLALGIDQVAHETVLDARGRTIAVLGCGMDVVYPAENKNLFERIADNGLILSEYPLGAEPRAYHFPRRNRILSGLALGVLVVEAHERSGSLITAYQALEQGREVFAIPGPVHHITSRGTHRLIREGATLVEGPEEIILSLSEHSGLLEFQSNSAAEFKQGLTSSEGFTETKTVFPEDEKEHSLLSLLRQQSRDYEGLFELSGMDPHVFAQVLTGLEIEGKIRKNLSGYYEMS